MPLSPKTIATQSAIDAWIAANWSDVVSRQEQYFSNHGQYFQGLKTHSTTPQEGSVSTADRMNEKPTDQDENWLEALALFPAGQQTHSVVECDVYNNSKGHGFVISFSFETSEGDVRCRKVNHGNDSSRSKDWHTVSKIV